MGPAEEKKGKSVRGRGGGEESTEVPKHAARPGQVPVCLSKAASLGTGLHLEVTWLHPESPAERQGRGRRPLTSMQAGILETRAS